MRRRIAITEDVATTEAEAAVKADPLDLPMREVVINNQRLLLPTHANGLTRQTQIVVAVGIATTTPAIAGNHIRDSGVFVFYITMVIVTMVQEKDQNPRKNRLGKRDPF